MVDNKYKEALAGMTPGERAATINLLRIKRSFLMRPDNDMDSRFKLAAVSTLSEIIDDILKTTQSH